MASGYNALCALALMYEDMGGGLFDLSMCSRNPLNTYSIAVRFGDANFYLNLAN